MFSAGFRSISRQRHAVSASVVCVGEEVMGVAVGFEVGGLMVYLCISCALFLIPVSSRMMGPTALEKTWCAIR